MKPTRFRITLLMLLLAPIFLNAQLPSTSGQSHYNEHQTQETQSISDIGDLEPQYTDTYTDTPSQELVASAVSFPQQEQRWDRVRVLDQQSKVVKVVSGKTSKHTPTKIDLSSLMPGVYFLEWWSPKGWVTKKIIKHS